VSRCVISPESRRELLADPVPSRRYGKQGFEGVIPPNSPLLFEVEVISISDSKMSIFSALFVLAIFVTVAIFLLKFFNKPASASAKKSDKKDKKKK
jgi:hypothetical protein